MSVVLLYCGLLSVSKSFLLITLCLLLFWGAKLLFAKGKVSLKFSVIFVAVIGGVFILSTTVFADSVNLILSRFSNDNSISDFTTKRTDIWLNYFRHFSDNPSVFFFGNGYTSVLVNEKAAHNTLIQLIFQFGIVGLSFYVVWLAFLVKKFFNRIFFKINDFMSVLILLIGCIGPWLALDMLFLDEFFLMPIIVFSGILFINKDSSENSDISVNESDIQV
jgi:O-antigen ligase